MTMASEWKNTFANGIDLKSMSEQIEKIHPQPMEAETFTEDDCEKLLQWIADQLADEPEEVEL